MSSKQKIGAGQTILMSNNKTNIEKLSKIHRFYYLKKVRFEVIASCRNSKYGRSRNNACRQRELFTLV